MDSQSRWVLSPAVHMDLVKAGEGRRSLTPPKGQVTEKDPVAAAQWREVPCYGNVRNQGNRLRETNEEGIRHCLVQLAFHSCSSWKMRT